MKKYKKFKQYKGKLLQIRLAEDEFKEVNEFIKKFKTTKREWILAVRNHLRDMGVIREESFWENDKSFAYFNSDRYDHQLTDDSKCANCGQGMIRDERGISQLQRHHYLGYKGENAFKVKVLCRKCHMEEHKRKRTKMEELYYKDITRHSDLIDKKK